MTVTALHRPAMITTARKKRITIMIDKDVIAAFPSKAQFSGRGYQTLMNEALRAALAEEDRRTRAKPAR
jgi:uncharacterized protein (DUF4415 family)